MQILILQNRITNVQESDAIDDDSSTADAKIIPQALRSLKLRKHI